jgi:putative tryptophan/tyrosine transport system substrate-binding protein
MGSHARIGAVTLLAWGAAASAAPILVVRTSELGPYKMVEASFSGALGQPTKSVSMTSGKDALKSALDEGPSLVFAIGADAAKGVAEAAPKAPTLYAMVPNPGKVGLDPKTPSVSMFPAPDSQLKAVKALLPNGKRIGVIFDPVASGPAVQELENAVSRAGLSLVKRPVSAQKDVAGAVRELLPQIDALLLVPDVTVVSADTFKFIAQTSLESRVPLIGFSEGMAKAGAVLAVEAGLPEVGKKAALTAKKMLAGDTPERQFADATLFVNTKSADLLGVTVSDALKGQAAKVYP